MDDDYKGLFVIMYSSALLAVSAMAFERNKDTHIPNYRPKLEAILVDETRVPKKESSDGNYRR